MCSVAHICRPHFCESLNEVYLIGQAVRDRSREFILPMSPDSTLSMVLLGQFFTKLVAAHDDSGAGAAAPGASLDAKEAAAAAAAAQVELTRDAIVVAIVDSDSTCAMYRMFKGLHAPPPSAMAIGDDDG